MDFYYLIEGVRNLSPYYLAALFVLLTGVWLWVAQKKDEVDSSDHSRTPGLHLSNQVDVADANIENSSVGNVKANNNTLQRNTHTGDVISGTGAVKVGGNVRNLATNNAPGSRRRFQTSATSETTRDLRNNRSSLDRSSTAVPPTSDIENAMTTILAGQPEENVRNVTSALHNLAVYTLEDFEDIKESDLIEAGIKVVTARKILRYYETQKD